MSTEIATRTAEAPLPERISKAIIDGDLSCLSADEKLQYYVNRCHIAGLPETCRPFAFIKTKQGKLILYALKECGELLNAQHRISHTLSGVIVDEKGGIVEAMVQATRGDGRSTVDVGAVSIQGLKGEDLANARMKAFTKAKRRSTLSLCGLGDIPDETELDTMGRLTQCNDNGTPIPADNGSGVGSGKYAAEVNTTAYREAIEGYLTTRNSEWLDRNTDRETNVVRAGITDLCNIWRADGHLAKWCEDNGLLMPGSTPATGIKNNQIGRLTAIPWFRSQKEQVLMKRELKRYLDDLERQQIEKIELAAAGPDDGEVMDAPADDTWEEGRE